MPLVSLPVPPPPPVLAAVVPPALLLTVEPSEEDVVRLELSSVVLPVSVCVPAPPAAVELADTSPEVVAVVEPVAAAIEVDCEEAPPIPNDPSVLEVALEATTALLETALLETALLEAALLETALLETALLEVTAASLVAPVVVPGATDPVVFDTGSTDSKSTLASGSPQPRIPSNVLTVNNSWRRKRGQQLPANDITRFLDSPRSRELLVCLVVPPRARTRQPGLEMRQK